MPTVLLLLSVAVGSLVIWVEGMHGFAVWNLTPVIPALAVAIFVPVYSVVFATVAAALVWAALRLRGAEPAAASCPATRKDVSER